MNRKNKRIIPGIPITIYWVATALLVFELGYGALWDFNLVNKGYVYNVMEQLGYPVYLAYILGGWKILATVAILAPGFLRLKEWAYAGAFFAFSGAIVSHVATDDIKAIIAPLVFISILLTSYYLRPSSKKLPDNPVRFW